MSEEWTAIARRYWDKAGVADRIELTLGPAAETLRELPTEPIDLAFLDADKPGYPAYYELLIGTLRPGRPDRRGQHPVERPRRRPRPMTTRRSGMREFNDLVADERVTVVMLPFADGLTMIER